MTSTREYTAGDKVLVNGKPATVTEDTAARGGWPAATAVNVIIEKPGRGPKQIDAPRDWIRPA